MKKKELFKIMSELIYEKIDSSLLTLDERITIKKFKNDNDMSPNTGDCVCMNLYYKSKNLCWIMISPLTFNMQYSPLSCIGYKNHNTFNNWTFINTSEKLNNFMNEIDHLIEKTHEIFDIDFNEIVNKYKKSENR